MNGGNHNTGHGAGRQLRRIAWRLTRSGDSWAATLADCATAQSERVELGGMTLAESETVLVPSAEAVVETAESLVRELVGLARARRPSSERQGAQAVSLAAVLAGLDGTDTANLKGVRHA